MHPSTRMAYGIPFQRLRPHSAVRQAMATRNTQELCHSGFVYGSVISAQARIMRYVPIK